MKINYKKKIGFLQGDITVAVTSEEVRTVTMEELPVVVEEIRERLTENLPFGVRYRIMVSVGNIVIYKPIVKTEETKQAIKFVRKLLKSNGKFDKYEIRKVKGTHFTTMSILKDDVIINETSDTYARANMIENFVFGIWQDESIDFDSYVPTPTVEADEADDLFFASYDKEQGSLPDEFDLFI